MGVIPDAVIDGWKEQYDDGADLWQDYPEIDRNEVLERVDLDAPIVLQYAFHGAQLPQGRKPIYVATAGAPLAGKSTILDQEMAANPVRYENAVKVDPDRWGMAVMPHTHSGYLLSAGMVANVPDGENFEYAQSRAYDVARPASNYLTLEIFNKAADANFDIAHGTTMTNPHIGSMLQGLKQKGYEIDLLLCGAEDDMRGDAQKYRAGKQGNYQSTPAEVISKGVEFPKRMQDYFELADNLSVFWRNDVTGNAVKAAEYTGGKKTVLDQDAYESFVNKYEADRAVLAADGTNLPSFKDVEQTYAARYAAQVTPRNNVPTRKP